ncbi:MAG: replicative DNA helicase [Pelagibacterales bacterium]|nr:replicative DNA helicase [Pelagibacterales bacterium]
MRKDTKTIESNTIYLPHNTIAEKIVLSSLIISSEAIEIALQKIKVETFYFKNHQEIYKAIIFLYQQKNCIDIITLTTFLQINGLLDQIGGIQIITDLIDQVPNLVYFEKYIQIIQDQFLRRLLIQFGYKTINSGYVTNIPIENILNELEKQFFYITNKNNNQDILSSAELFSNTIKELRQKSLNPSLPGIASGFYALDLFTQGFQKSDLIIFAGRPSMGKTALCLNIALNIIKTYKSPILFFSLEMSKEQLMYRLLANEMEINNRRLKAGHISQENWSLLKEIVKNLSSLPLFIDDSPNISVQEIRSKIKKILFEHNNINLVIIDYLQLIQNSSIKTSNRTQELSYVTSILKSMAREFKVPIIVLSQLSRNVENRINKRPILSDLRDSGSIEQDADLVLMLYRESYYNLNLKESEIAELVIAKHRNGPTGSIKLKFKEKYAKFINLEN